MVPVQATPASPKDELWRLAEVQPHYLGFVGVHQLPGEGLAPQGRALHKCQAARLPASSFRLLLSGTALYYMSKWFYNLVSSCFGGKIIPERQVSSVQCTIMGWPL